MLESNGWEGRPDQKPILTCKHCGARRSCYRGRLLSYVEVMGVTFETYDWTCPDCMKKIVDTAIAEMPSEDDDA